MADSGQGGTDPSWNDQAKSAFNDFTKRKRALPSPPDYNQLLSDHKKTKNFDLRGNRFNAQSNSRKDLFEKNRVTSGTFNVSRDESTFSQFHMSVENECEVEPDLDKTEVSCDEIEKKLAIVKEMIKKKDDVYDILDKLTDDLAEFYKNTREKIQKCNSDNSKKISCLNNQMVSLENNLYDKINCINEQNQEKFNAMEVSNKCAKENCVLWLSFIDPKEVDSLRLKNKSELIKEAKKIFNRMEIWMNSINRQIYDVFIQKVSVKAGNGYENETLMGIKFASSGTVLELKRLVMNYAKKQFLAQNLDSVRYTVRDNWSPSIWKLLRVCYDLSNFKLIDNAHVSDFGILVYYRKEEISENDEKKDVQMKKLIRTESDLDDLRQKIDDPGCEFRTFRVYDGNYFKLSIDEKKLYKLSLKKSTAQEQQLPGQVIASSSPK